jgi:hypothetical protein
MTDRSEALKIAINASVSDLREHMRRFAECSQQAATKYGYGSDLHLMWHDSFMLAKEDYTEACRIAGVETDFTTLPL